MEEEVLDVPGVELRAPGGEVPRGDDVGVRRDAAEPSGPLPLAPERLHGEGVVASQVVEPERRGRVRGEKRVERQDPED